MIPDQNHTLSYKVKGIIWPLMVIIAFILANVVCIAYDQWAISLVPAAIIIFLFIFVYPDKALLVLAFCTPFSRQIELADMGLGISLPSEPILIVFLMLFWLRLVITGQFDLQISKHPITIILFTQTLWVLVTSLSSTMPLVSIKFFISRLWFITSFYLIGSYYYKKPSFILAFVMAFVVSMLFPIGYAWSRHVNHNFNQAYSSKALVPYFSDHGIYAVVLTMFIPFLAIIAFYGGRLHKNNLYRIFAATLLGIFLLALVWSYTRAAWIGMACATILFIILRLKIKFRQVVFMLLFALVGLAFLQNTIYEKLRENKTVSQSKKDDVNKVLKSVTNISTDASNTERINRWKSAFRMWKEKPILGWGPGTYMFQYASYQLSSEMTIISTRGGNLGNAHSEYIGPLVEQGVLGCLFMVLLLFVMLYYGMKLVYSDLPDEFRYLAMAALLGLTTYFIHGFLNNYLDVDKAASPFYALLGMLCAIDIQYKGSKGLLN
ncbi:MAG: O-antigen ligase family protein [Bacteroidota bacterium]|nr:O-antigen ligase family protein [Bacteroidota bacterium]